MKILITGGGSFIGSHLVAHYQGRADILVLDNFRSGRRENLAGLSCWLVEGSILDRKLTQELMTGIDRVFHFAALVSVPESMRLPAETVSLNVHGLLNVLESAREAGVGKLCTASSAAVYGENAESPKIEAMRPDPRSSYAITKLDGEYYFDLFAWQGCLSTVCLRSFNVFGPRQDPAGVYAAAVPIFIPKAIQNEPLTIHGDGGQTRDFIFVGDIVSALAFLAEKPEVHGVFNAGYGENTSIRQLVTKVIQLTQSHSEIIHAAPCPGDIRYSSPNVTKLHSADWLPRFDFDRELKMTVEALLRQ